MKYQQVIDLIEEKQENLKVQRLKKALKSHLVKVQEDNFLEKALVYYYLLEITFSAHTLYETAECHNYYEKMKDYLKKQEDFLNILKEKKGWSNPLKDLYREFFKTTEKCFASLEFLYEKKSFHERAHDAYEMKMNFRRKKFWFEKRYWNWFEYVFFDATSKYGDSFFRWGMTSLVFALLMAGIYALSDHYFIANGVRLVTSGHWYDYIYFSITTLTTLGFGDVVPVTLLTKFLANVEVFFGYIMLGIFISLIQKKL